MRLTRRRIKAIAALEQAGQPIVTIELANKLQVVQQFFQWETGDRGGRLHHRHQRLRPARRGSEQDRDTQADRRLFTLSGKLPDEARRSRPTACSSSSLTTKDAAAVGQWRRGLDSEGAFRACGCKAITWACSPMSSAMPTRRGNGSSGCVCRSGTRKKVATAAEFGPRFLHSTGQAYKGGLEQRRVPADHRGRREGSRSARARNTRSAWSRPRRRAAISTFWSSADGARLRVHITGDLARGLKPRWRRAIAGAV